MWPELYVHQPSRPSLQHAVNHHAWQLNAHHRKWSIEQCTRTTSRDTNHLLMNTTKGDDTITYPHLDHHQPGDHPR